MKISRRLFTLGALAAATRSYGEKRTADAPAAQELLEQFRVDAPAAALPDGVTELKFREFFKPRPGLSDPEPTERLASLAGKHVRLVGYMARPDPAFPGVLVLSATRAVLGASAEESIVDGLPPSATYVHLDPANTRPLAHLPGLLQFTGILELGPLTERDGHVSHVRLRLDEEASRALLAVSAFTLARR